MLTGWKSPSRRPSARCFNLDSATALWDACRAVNAEVTWREVMKAFDEKVKLGLDREARGGEIDDWISWLIKTVPPSLARRTGSDTARKQAEKINRRAKAAIERGMMRGAENLKRPPP
jgi:hypothetical protein